MDELDNDVNLPQFDKDNVVWIETGKHSEAMWQQATVVEQTGVFVLCMTEAGRAINLDIRDDSVFPVNPSSQPDMTGLYFINEPGILFNLEDRSLSDKPYTFMGNVLVAVNPLKRIEDPSVTGTLEVPHPFTVAQNAFAQLKFAHHNNQTDINQSVVTSGESGAGKTECCKMVLKYLVENLESVKGSNIDERLLESNHITESFGNAQTLRNHNSSRFGKFMKLHFRPKNNSFEIIGASVETYLLERSRVSLHNEGERNYHIFHQIVEGANQLKHLKSLKSSFSVAEKSKVGFRLLSPLTKSEEISNKTGYKKSKKKDDSKSFKAVIDAMTKLNFPPERITEIFEVVGGILHLGNFVFTNKNINNTETAILDDEILDSYDVCAFAAEFLGIEKEILLNLVTKEDLVIRMQKVTKIFDKYKACFTRDALVKSLYSHLFDVVIKQIDEALTLTTVEEDSEEEIPFIGILDIFGFESFKRNDFEQLLINFANEALQATFNRSVFENEAALYKRERLLLNSSDLIRAPSNSACMNLFVGLGGKGKRGEKQEDYGKRRGLLLVIDDESMGLEPSDKKMLGTLHRLFGKHQDWKKPHPKQRQEVFIVKHFAGEVKYSVGFFLEKNRDQLPKNIINVFASSTKSILTTIGKKKVSSSKTIIKKFKTQIGELVDTLESTKCSFIRCVKPNEEMKRGKSSKWFNRRYISHQLRNLSIPQTAEVLQNGFPTRLTYASLMESYLKLIPDDALNGWKKLVERKANTASNFSEASFVKSLLFAFEVEQNSFKLGLTMVFFKSGGLAKLDKILKSAADFESFADRDRVVQRFVYYFVRLRWREVYAKVLAFNKFKAVLDLIRERERLRKERERLEKERKERERLERERLEKQEKERLEKLEQERLEEEERIRAQLEEERLRREKQLEAEKSVREEDNEEKDEKIANLVNAVELKASVKVKRKFKGRGASVTPLEITEATRTALQEVEAEVAKMEAQTRMEENLRGVYNDIVKDSNQFWRNAADNIKESIQGLGEYFMKFSEGMKQVKETETYQRMRARHRHRMIMLKRTFRVTNRLLLRAARRSEWFQQAEEKLNRIQERIAQEFENQRLIEEGLEDVDMGGDEEVVIENLPVPKRNATLRRRKGSVRSRGSIRSVRRMEGGSKVQGYLVLDREEAQSGRTSAMEHIDKVKEMVQNGLIPPSALGDLVNVMERGTKEKSTLVLGQHMPKNSDDQEPEVIDVDTGFPEINPSNDASTKWCSTPLAYDKGFFYISLTPSITRRKKLSILCGWEHKDPKKKKRLYSHWDCDLSILHLAMIYDTLLSSKDADIRAIVAAGGEMPEFPGWNHDQYQKGFSKRKASKAGKQFASGSNVKTRGERMRFLSTCVDISVAQDDPALIGMWLGQLFEEFSQVDTFTGNAQLLEIPLIVEMFDVDTYGGVVNL